jgi:hypothetical protein
MPIDDCCHTFQELAETVLPRYMAQLRCSMAQPMLMAGFAVPGAGVVTIARSMNRGRDFSGCYVLIEGESPIYVGISRKVITRLRQHVTGRGHEDATLAYRMATAAMGHSMSRKDAMADPQFRLLFHEKREHLKTMTAAFVEIDNAVEMHVFEACCAMELDTCVWNTFATH